MGGFLHQQPKDPRFLLVKDAKEVFYNDLSPAAADPWLSQFNPQCMASFASPVDSAAWESGLVPCTYVSCERDQGVYFWLQERMLDHVSKESPRGWKVERTKSNHSAWLTEVPTLVRLIEEAAAADA